MTVQAEHLSAEQIEALKRALGHTIEDLREALRNKKECYEKETLKVGQLQQELSGLKESSIPLVEYTQMKETLEQEIVAIKTILREKEEVAMLNLMKDQLGTFVNIHFILEVSFSFVRIPTAWKEVEDF